MAKTNKLVAPFLKWVGGKRQLIPEISEILPKNLNQLNYVEPFIGGGALFFYLQPKTAIINDLNTELINVYKVIKSDVNSLIKDLRKHKNEIEYFYKIRSLDRSESFNKLTDVERASRIIYLNKTCYNGLYRVNNSGEFNAPFGRYTNPNIVNEPTLKAVNIFLNSSNIEILNKNYFDILKTTNNKSFVYLDPPYHPLTESSNFTGYIKGGWSVEDQIELRDACDMLNKKGIKFLLSNSNTALIRSEYKNYNIKVVKANRSINSDSTNRGEIDEVLITNYE